MNATLTETSSTRHGFHPWRVTLLILAAQAPWVIALLILDGFAHKLRTPLFSMAFPLMIATSSWAIIAALNYRDRAWREMIKQKAPSLYDRLGNA